VSNLHPIFEQILSDLGMPQTHCERCEQFDQVHDQNCPKHPDYDPTPYCTHCGPKANCTCPPHPEND
jgi:hypothetical protein